MFSTGWALCYLLSEITVSVISKVKGFPRKRALPASPDVTAAMLMIKNDSISLRWELNSTFMQIFEQ